MSDNVNHPAHYAPKFGSKTIECIDITRHMSFLLGNAFKYVWRAGDKGDKEKAIEDIDKAIFYLTDYTKNKLGDTSSLSIQLFSLLEDDGTKRYSALKSIVKGHPATAIVELEKFREEFE